MKMPSVYLREPRRRDHEEFAALMRASRRLHRGWVQPPVRPEQFDNFVGRCRKPDFAGFFACRVADDRIVGVFSLSQIFRGNFRSAYLGYYAGETFAGQGYMSEGLRLVLARAFGPLKLHRVEANIQPENAASIALVRRAGFVREGFSRRYLKIAGRWRDHERWALLAEDWRAARRRR